MSVKTHIPGTTVSIGYETETADRATIRCLVLDETSHTAAIDAAVLSVGDTLFTGTLNVPLISAEAVSFGTAKWNVALTYGRSARARRRTQTDRRIRIASKIDYVDAYLVNSSTYLNGYKHSATPGIGDWYSITTRKGVSGPIQVIESAPRPYKILRPTMLIEIAYSTAFLTINDAELSKNGKLNSNTFPVPEIGGVFGVNTLRYVGFSSQKQDIGQYPWSTTLELEYDPAGHYRQQAVWDDTASAWKTVSNHQVSESTTF